MKDAFFVISGGGGGGFKSTNFWIFGQANGIFHLTSAVHHYGYRIH